VTPYIQQMPPDRWTDLAGRFGLGLVQAAPSFVARGAMGTVWRLETDAGRWAVKWLFPWSPADPRPADVAVQIAAAAAGIPLPHPVLLPDGAAVITVGGQPARVYEWADLAAPLTPPVPPAAAAEAGRLLGLLHSLALAPAEPDDPWYSEVPAAGYWPDLAGRAAAAGAAWAAGLSAARGLIAELQSQVMPPQDGPRIVCHRDFNPGNVLPAAPDGRLIVLDWENSGPLPPRRELGYALFCWSAGAGRRDQQAARAFLAGYGGAAGHPTASGTGTGLFATAIATHLNMLRAMSEQALTEPEHRDFAEDVIAGLLGHDLPDLLEMISQSGTEGELL
jgi:aminoglycoside phosphotransferase (APT) family kinase protein